MSQVCVSRIVVGLLALLALPALVRPAAAQSAPSTGPYLQVGPVVTLHTEGEQYFRTSPPLAEPTIGASVAVGGWVSPVLAFEAEAVLDGKQSDDQSFSYSWRDDYTAESRDILLGANLRMRLGRAPVEVTVGGGAAFTRFARRNQVSTPVLPPGPPSTARDTRTSTTSPTASASLAVVVPASPRLQVVPSIAVRWIKREFDSEAWYFGMGRYMVTVGATLRIGG